MLVEILFQYLAPLVTDYVVDLVLIKTRNEPKLGKSDVCIRNFRAKILKFGYFGPKSINL